MEDVALRDTFSGHGADGLDWVILVGFSNLIDYSPGAGSLPAPAALTSKFCCLWAVGPLVPRYRQWQPGACRIA